MARYGSGSVPIATGWKCTNCRRTHRSSIPRSASGNTRARPALTTDTSRPPRNWSAPCPGSSERCNTILSQSDLICFLFADRYVPLIMRGCIVLFYEKTLASENVARLYMRRGIRGDERLILDPTKLDKPSGPPHVINYYTPSWNGQYVVVGISEGGSEQAVIHIVETASGRESPETIDRAPFGIVTWKDAQSFFYHRLQKMLPGMPETEKQLKSTVWLHTVGGNVENDLPIFGYDRSPAVPVDPIACMPGATGIRSFSRTRLVRQSILYTIGAAFRPAVRAYTTSLDGPNTTPQTRLSKTVWAPAGVIACRVGITPGSSTVRTGVSQFGEFWARTKAVPSSTTATVVRNILMPKLFYTLSCSCSKINVIIRSIVSDQAQTNQIKGK